MSARRYKILIIKLKSKTKKIKEKILVKKWGLNDFAMRLG